MKEIRKEIKKELIETQIQYEAIDGTVFQNVEECRKYETTAECVLKEKFNKLIVNREHTEFSLFGTGNDDCEVVAIRMKNEKDKDTVLQLFFLKHNYLILDSYKESREKFINLVEQAFQNLDLLLLCTNCEGDFYYIDTRNNIINRLNNLDKAEHKETKA